VHEVDRLKREMTHYGQHLESVHRQGINQQRGNMEHMERELVTVRMDNESVRDENV
jgi:hypothetical protein